MDVTTAIVVTAAATAAEFLFVIMLSINDWFSTTNNDVGERQGEFDALTALTEHLVCWGLNALGRRVDSFEGKGEECSRAAVQDFWKATVGFENKQRTPQR
mmetsp:Transcript_6918/g.16947  ORF Transcript_6918/g.16947 Transcript_6918/m.16947 type:complete len:101 (+) Transcript_6918:4195-4497(+)